MKYQITAQKGCDLVVIGGGGGGMVAGARAAWLSGEKVIVLEKIWPHGRRCNICKKSENLRE